MKNISLLLIMLFLAIVTRAQVPGTISFQGSLTEPGTNSPVADGDYNVVFTLFDALSAGSSVWTETHSTLSVADGTFNVLLGKNTPLDPAEFNKPLFLEISVGGETLTPRIELASSAFSQSAKSVAGAGNNVPSSGNVYIGGDLQVGGVAPTIDLAIDDDDTGLEVDQDGKLSFYSNNVERMTLLPAGNLGIGTMTPSAELDVVGTVKADDFTLNTPKVSYYSVPPSQFKLALGGTEATYYLNSSYYDVYVVGGVITNPAYLIAPLNLPHNATITRIDLYYQDSDASYDISASLYGVNHGTTATAISPLIGTSSGTPGNAVMGINMNHVVDNSLNQYWIYVVTRQANSSLRVKSAVITYETSNP